MKCKHLLTILFVLSLTVSNFGQSNHQSSKLLKRDRERLAQLRADNKRETTLVIAASSGKTDAIARRVTDLGGSIRYRRDDVDYLRVTVPIERVEEIARLESIVSCNLDGGTFYQTGDDETGSIQISETDKPKPPDKDTPAENPYMPTRDMGGPQFTAKNPTWDGRGATIAIIEAGYPDVLTPELQTATRLDGNPTRKLVGVINANGPDDEAFFRVSMKDSVISKEDLQIIFNGTAYKVPQPGSYRIGLFSLENPERYTMIPGAVKPFPVLLDEITETVWVDTNQNNDFSDEQSLTDYNKNYHFGLFGKDNPATPLREAVAFIVLVDSQDKQVYVLPSIYAHMTMVSGVAAGKGFFGGKMNGAAPEAQIVAVNAYPITQHSLIKALIAAMEDSRVDLVSVQIASRERLNDGDSTQSIIWDRLIKKYKKPVFMSAGNTGPGINSGYYVAAGNNSISVGGSVDNETWWSNHGVKGSKKDYVINLSARGPRADGGFKPDIIAPLIVVTSGPGYAPGSPTPGTYTLPPGYFVGGGTSSSSPMAAGGGALLVSAAKQSGVPYDSGRLKWAIKSSARFLSEYAANDQGSGLINIPAAWEALKKAPELTEITSRADVKTVVSSQLSEPNSGAGIFEREGWQAGQKAERQIIFTRTSGPNKPVNYSVRWMGNNGTFKSSTTITLPLNVPIKLPVEIAPKTSGVHSATIALDEVDGVQAVYEVMNTVVAAEQFTKANNFTVTKTAQYVDYPGHTSYFFNVPNGVSALKFEAKTNEQKNLRLRFYEPSGNGYLLAARAATADNWSQTIQNPEPGVWEVVVHNNNNLLEGERSAAKWSADFEFTASIYGVDIKIDKTRELKRGVEQKIELTNSFAPFKASIAETPLASAYSEKITLSANSVPVIKEIDIPEKTEYFIAETNFDSDLSADVDIYLYDCTGEECLFRDASIRSGSKESVFAANPKAGKWKIVIDPVAMPSGKITINYNDAFTNPAFGKLTSSNELVALGTGDKRLFTITPKPDNSTVTNGRYPAALLTISGEGFNTLDFMYFIAPAGNGLRPGFLNPTERPTVIGTSIIRVK